MITFKQGKKVKVKYFKDRPGTWNSSGEMDVWMGKTVTMDKGYGNGGYGTVKIKEDNGKWSWNLDDFEDINAFKLLNDKLFRI